MTRALLLSALLFLGALIIPADTPGAAMQPGYNDCPANAAAMRGTNRELSCRCSASATRSGSVWGSDVYTDDSTICRAALHAGAVGENGGLVTLRPVEGRSSYDGSQRNGVASADFGRWQASYQFSGGSQGGDQAVVERCPADGGTMRGRQTFRCQCDASATRSGQVWGTGIYTDDSAICRAAVHAGATTLDGGVVTLIRRRGRDSYEGSSRNNVSTSNFGRWDGSYRFVGAEWDGWSDEEETGDASGGNIVACPANGSALRGVSEPQTCRCSASELAAGQIWGSDDYRDQSSICRAALHAGAVRPEGGVVTLRMTGGRLFYPGSTRNGVRSDGSGPAQASFSFDR